MLKKLCIPAVLALGVVNVQAEQSIMIAVEPGSWETRGEATMLSDDYSQSLADTHCIRTTQLDPLEAFANAGECQAIVISRQSGFLKMNVSCRSLDAPIMAGIVEFRHTTVEIDGSMRMETRVGEQVFVVESRWHGERVGECPDGQFAMTE